MRNGLLGLGALLAFGVGVGAPAFAGSEAILADGLAQPRIIVLDGKVWTCAGPACTARLKGDGQPAGQECARLSRRLGVFAAYARDGQPLRPDQLAACNGRSTPQPVQALHRGEDRDFQHQQRGEAAGQPRRLAGRGAP